MTQSSFWTSITLQVCNKVSFLSYWRLISVSYPWYKMILDCYPFLEYSICFFFICFVSLQLSFISAFARPSAVSFPIFTFHMCVLNCYRLIYQVNILLRILSKIIVNGCWIREDVVSLYKRILLHNFVIFLLYVQRPFNLFPGSLLGIRGFRLLKLRLSL